MLTVSVRDGVVASATMHTPPPYPVPPILDPRFFPTVEEIFEAARDAIGRRDDYFRADYEPALGYPTRVMTGDSGALDSGLELIVRNLRAVP